MIITEKRAKTLKKSENVTCLKVKSMVDFENKIRYDVYDLKKIINILREPGGCPWDSEQTHQSIRRNLLEEAYEAAEAIDTSDTELLREELGDVLMQIVFHSDIEEKAGHFELDDVADAACRKLIRRHPHVFGNADVKDAQEVIVNWDNIKSNERNHKKVTDEMLSVAKSLPALWRAEKIQQKAAKVGFDWPDHTGALDALRSELRELEDAIESGSGISEELGDLVFSAVNLSRFFEVDLEDALGYTSDKFIKRFGQVEKSALSLQKNLQDMTLDEMEDLYIKAKLEE